MRRSTHKRVADTGHDNSRSQSQAAASPNGAMVSVRLVFFHGSAERRGPDWGPLNSCILENELYSIACVAYWLPFTAPAAGAAFAGFGSVGGGAALLARCACESTRSSLYPRSSAQLSNPHAIGPFGVLPA